MFLKITHKDAPGKDRILEVSDLSKFCVDTHKCYTVEQTAEAMSMHRILLAGEEYKINGFILKEVVETNL